MVFPSSSTRRRTSGCGVVAIAPLFVFPQRAAARAGARLHRWPSARACFQGSGQPAISQVVQTGAWRTRSPISAVMQPPPQWSGGQQAPHGWGSTQQQQQQQQQQQVRRRAEAHQGRPRALAERM